MGISIYWVQVRDLTVASLKARYRKTWAGFIWVILNPVLMFGVQSLVFKKFLKLNIPDYYLFLLGGLLPWIFFSQTVQMGTPVFVTQAHLLRSFKVNPLVILGSQVLDNFINFVATFTIILLPFYISADRPLNLLPLIPLALLPLLLGSLALAIILGTLNVFYRDINFIMGFIFSVLFFLTPVFYPKEYVPEQWQWLMDLNFVTHFIDPFRQLIYLGSVPDFFSSLTKGMGLTAILGALAYITWKRKLNEFYRKL